MSIGVAKVGRLTLATKLHGNEGGSGMPLFVIIGSLHQKKRGEALKYTGSEENNRTT